MSSPSTLSGDQSHKTCFRRHILQLLQRNVLDVDATKELQHLVCTYSLFHVTPVEFLDDLLVASKCRTKVDSNYWKLNSMLEFILELWFDLWREDFIPAVKDQVLAFSTKIFPKDKIQYFKARLLSKVDKGQLSFPQVSDGQVWLHSKPNVMALHLAFVSWKFLKQLSLRSLFHQDDKHELLSQIERQSHSISSWVSAAIIQGGELKPAKMAKIVEKFVLVMTSLFALNDYHSLEAIFRGLSGPSIRHQEELWQKLRRKTIDSIVKFESLFSAEKDYRDYKQQLSKLSKLDIPTVPCFSILVQQFKAVLDGQDLVADSKVNKAHVNQIGQMVLSLHFMQRLPPPPSVCRPDLTPTFHLDDQLLGFCFSPPDSLTFKVQPSASLSPGLSSSSSSGITIQTKTGSHKELDAATKDFHDAFAEISECYPCISASQASELIALINSNASMLSYAVDLVRNPLAEDIDRPLTSRTVKKRPKRSSSSIRATPRVFVWGCNEKSQLGLGHDTRNKYAPAELTSFQNNIDCISVAAGAGFSSLVSANGDVYTWGEGSQGQLGHGDLSTGFFPRRVTTMRASVKEVACGDTYQFFVTRNGKVVVSGSNQQNALGIPGKTVLPECKRVQGILKKYKMKGISTCTGHTLALTDQGNVFVWGTQSFGRLGTEEKEACIPTLLLKLGKLVVVQVSCGAEHSAVLTNTGDLYTFGDGSNGRLGHGTTEDTKDPKIVEALRSQVTIVKCGYDHTLATTRSGDVVTWGYGANGRLGLGDEEDRLIPQKVLLPEKVSLIACGGYHTAATTVSGKLFCWGWNAYGQCGVSDNVEAILTPTLVESLSLYDVMSVACGEQHTVCVARE